jgi:hypothetical protein
MTTVLGRFRVLSIDAHGFCSVPRAVWLEATDPTARSIDWPADQLQRSFHAATRLRMPTVHDSGIFVFFFFPFSFPPLTRIRMYWCHPTDRPLPFLTFVSMSVKARAIRWIVHWLKHPPLPNLLIHAFRMHIPSSSHKG